MTAVSSSAPAASPTAASKVDRFIKRNHIKIINTAQRAFVNLVVGKSNGPKDQEIVALFAGRGTLPEMETTVYAMLKEGREIAKDEKGTDFRSFDELVQILREEASENLYPVLNEIKTRYSKEKNKGFLAHVEGLMKGLAPAKFKVSERVVVEEPPAKEMATWKKVLIVVLAIGVGIFVLSRIFPTQERGNSSIVAPKALQCDGHRCCPLMKRGSFRELASHRPNLLNETEQDWSNPQSCVANRKWSKHGVKKVVQRTTERMKKGDFGTEYTKIGDASEHRLDRSYAVSFAVFVNQIQESTSFRSFRKHALPSSKPVLPLLSEEQYLSIKNGDVSQLDQVLAATPLLSKMRESPAEAKQDYRALPPLARLYVDFQLGRSDDFEMNQAFYDTTHTHDSVRRDLYEQSGKAGRIKSYSGEKIEKELEMFVDSKYLNIRELHSGDEQELIACVRAPAFHRVSLAVRTQLLDKASFFGWSTVLREILHAKGAEEFSAPTLEKALDYAARYRDEEVVEILKEPHFAEKISPFSYADAVVAAARYDQKFDELEANIPNELQIQTLEHLRHFPHLANMDMGRRRQIVDRALTHAYNRDVRAVLLTFLK